MNINWVLANDYVPDPTIDLAQLRAYGAFWGGWQTWRASATDNVICHDTAKAQELIQRAFQATCNFYVPNSAYVMLDRPQGVRLYEGEFVHDLDDHEEIVALHLTAGISDIVLLLGFDISEADLPTDRLQRHRALNYRNLFKQVIQDNNKVQWVMIDHEKAFRKDLTQLQNLSSDTLENVRNILQQSV
jgi:hypothetical protein